MYIHTTVVGKKTSDVDVVYILINVLKSCFYDMNMTLSVSSRCLGRAHELATGYRGDNTTACAVM